MPWPPMMLAFPAWGVVLQGMPPLRPLLPARPPVEQALLLPQAPRPLLPSGQSGPASLPLGKALPRTPWLMLKLPVTPPRLLAEALLPPGKILPRSLWPVLAPPLETARLLMQAPLPLASAALPQPGLLLKLLLLGPLLPVRPRLSLAPARAPTPALQAPSLPVLLPPWAVQQAPQMSEQAQRAPLALLSAPWALPPQVRCLLGSALLARPSRSAPPQA
mmetsp:Transcript_30845/g.95953  ORF Transcript_30845/g.95953 Transcript_30845/m.95953 type:complete len:219 (-) Transcript_30845:356-1012(-)